MRNQVRGGGKHGCANATRFDTIVFFVGQNWPVINTLLATKCRAAFQNNRRLIGQDYSDRATVICRLSLRLVVTCGEYMAVKIS